MWYTPLLRALRSVCISCYKPDSEDPKFVYWNGLPQGCVQYAYIDEVSGLLLKAKINEDAVSGAGTVATDEKGIVYEVLRGKVEYLTDDEAEEKGYRPPNKCRKRLL